MTTFVGIPELHSSAERILEVTEKLCAERGLEAVSMRDIAKAAGISISVLYHHFGSKVNLLKTALNRRLGDLGQLRAELFADLERDPNPDLERLLYAIIAPYALLRLQGEPGEIAARFIARALFSSIPEIKEEINTGVGRLKQIVELAQRAAPHLSREDVYWRLHFTFGIEHLTPWDYERLEIMSDGACAARSADEAVARAVAFAKAAFLAP